MKLRIKVGDQEIVATLVDSETTRDFVSLLPLTLTMNDLFKREKFAHIPRAISEGGKHTHTYAVGDVIYWPPGPDVAVFYRHDGEAMRYSAGSPTAMSTLRSSSALQCFRADKIISNFASIRSIGPPAPIASGIFPTGPGMATATAA